jgi:protoheme IX farnesyltransferase
MKSKAGNKIRIWLEFSKLRIMLPVSLTGFTGFFAFNPHLSPELLFTTFGILLMAISASVLNQIQESGLDGKMARTCNRPLPSKKIRLQDAILFFVITLITGLAFIFFGGNFKAALIGLITIIWYNGIYTYSKRITAFAVVPGAVTGALPPVIGWVGAGGGLWDKPVIFIAFLIFIGQIPHFWLLIMKYGEDYKKAGIPSLTDVFNLNQIRRLTFAWVVSSVVAGLFLCYFEIIQSPMIIIVLVGVSIFTIWKFIDLLKTGINKNDYVRYSAVFDFYFLLILLLLISDRIIN